MPRHLQAIVLYAACVAVSPLMVLVSTSWLVAVMLAKLVVVLEALVHGLWETLLAMVKAIDGLLDPLRRGTEPPRWARGDDHAGAEVEAAPSGEQRP